MDSVAANTPDLDVAERADTAPEPLTAAEETKGDAFETIDYRTNLVFGWWC